MFGLVCQLFVHCLISLARIRPLVVLGPQGEVNTCSYILGSVMELTLGLRGNGADRPVGIYISHMHMPSQTLTHKNAH